MKNSPSQSEKNLLHFLNEELDDDIFEIFYKPHCDFINPQIVIVEKFNKITIMNVCEEQIENNINLDDINKNINKDKFDLYPYLNINGPTTMYKGILKLFDTICFFSNLNQNIINKKEQHIFNKKEQHEPNFKKTYWMKSFGKDNKHDLIRRIKRHNDTITQSNLQKNQNRLEKYLEIKNKIKKTPFIFDEKEYNSFKNFIHPPIHKQEEGLIIKYTPEQEKIIYSNAKKSKIKGVAGSGKTMIAVKKAVFCYNKTRNRVLILCFNKTLKNYIQTKLNEVYENFDWNDFPLTNYHTFISRIENTDGETAHMWREEDIKKKNYGKVIRDDYDDIEFFKNSKFEKFDTIIIDEIQDFKKQWLIILTNYFLEPDGEFHVFGDEKQNIFERKMGEDRYPLIPTIPGAWNKLKIQNRSQENISFLVYKFQKKFLSEKYDIDNIPTISNQLNTVSTTQINDYFFVQNNLIEIIKKINEIRISYPKQITHNGDICILCEDTFTIANINSQLKNKFNIETISTVEDQETLKFINEKVSRKTYNEFIRPKYKTLNYKTLETYKKRYYDRHLKSTKNKERNALRNKFTMQNNALKLSTISSFKGWEISTLILIIDNTTFIDNSEKHELIYTALTRARNNLFIFNMGNQNYHEFFKETFMELPKESLGSNLKRIFSL